MHVCGGRHDACDRRHEGKCVKEVIEGKRAGEGGGIERGRETHVRTERNVS